MTRLRWPTGDVEGSIEAERQAARVHDRCGLHRFQLMDTIDATARAWSEGRLPREQAWAGLRALTTQATLEEIVAGLGFSRGTVRMDATALYPRLRSTGVLVPLG